MKNHLQRKNILLDSKQETISKENIQIIIWQYVRQNKQPFGYILDVQLTVLVSFTIVYIQKQ